MGMPIYRRILSQLNNKLMMSKNVRRKSKFLKVFFENFKKFHKNLLKIFKNHRKSLALTALHLI